MNKQEFSASGWRSNQGKTKNVLFLLVTYEKFARNLLVLQKMTPGNIRYQTGNTDQILELHAKTGLGEFAPIK